MKVKFIYFHLSSCHDTNIFFNLFYVNYMDFCDASERAYCAVINLHSIYAWFNSSIAHTWTKSSAHRWKTFVRNRVTYRIGLHLILNSADMLLRGLSSDAHIQNSFDLKLEKYMVSILKNTKNRNLSSEENTNVFVASVCENCIASLLNNFLIFS